MQYFDRVVDVPAAVHRQGFDVPVISQRCLRFSSLHELGYDGSEGIFGAFCAIFALLRLSGVERQSSVGEPSMTKSSSSSRAGGVALTPGVSPRCQATSCA